MSHPTAARRDSWARLPNWLRPREHEQAGRGSMRLIETTLLVLVGIVLAVATVNDLARQAGINHRLLADLATWRSHTGHQYREITVDQELLGARTEHEVVCGNTSPGAPKARTQLCLVIWGPTVNGRRTIHGGWYLSPGSEDQRSTRFGCFGTGAEGFCPR